MRSGWLPAVRLAVAVVLSVTPGSLAPSWLKPSTAEAQEDAAGGDESLFFPADRASLQRLATAKGLLKEKRYDEAVRFLDTILEGPEDYFFQPDRNERIFRSLKTEAQRLLGQMPSKGHASYELQFGARAKQMLDEAAKNCDPSLLAEVSRQFFHTKAGYEATELLGTYHMEQGRPLAAALCFKRLDEAGAAAAAFQPAVTIKMAVCWARAGLPAQAKETLLRLKLNNPGATIVVDGHERKLWNRDSQAMAWLAEFAGPAQLTDADAADQWALYRGNAPRNAVSVGSSPLLNRRWAVPTANDPQIEKTVEQMRQSYVDQGSAALPAWHPLAVNDQVFMRTITGLVAIDFKTGKRIWRGPTDEAVRQILEPEASNASFNDTSTLGSWLEQRVWDDATYGTMSSDGKCVFCVEDLGTGLVADSPRTLFLANARVMPQSVSVKASNRLAAYEIATEGKLKWELPGSDKSGSDKSELAGAFFLGPPLPLAEHLYALAEIKGEIRVLALDAKTGALEWSQQLAVLEQSIVEDVVRRVAGLSPSYSDGVLVCPTAAGAIVAVDLTTRSLLWGYQYATTSLGPRGRMRAFQFGPPHANEEPDHWSDSSITLAEGRVLLTPRESQEGGFLHCVNLVDGKLLWKKSRDDGLYIGCVFDDKLLVVGRGGLRALKLSDGEPVWKEGTVTLPAGSMTSGRGFFNGSRYFLPLSSAEVAAINVQTGRIVARSKSRSGEVAGNLICYKGAVISQGVDELESFFQLDDLREQVTGALAKNPADPAALALRGELLLDEGKLDEAIGQLRRSFETRPDARTRQLLVDALLEGLRLDFARHRQQMPEIERLIEQPTQQLAYLRQVAVGLQKVGEILPAFETYLKLMDLPRTGDELERIDNSLAARRDRWVQARLADLLKAASADDRESIEKVLRVRLDAARLAGPNGLREFVSYFGGHPLADEACERLLDVLPASATSLEREQWLRRLEKSSKPERARAATAQLANLLEKAGRDEDAAICYRQLAGPWADLVCLDGKTGRQLIAELPAPIQAQTSVALADRWPTGRVDRTVVKDKPVPPSRSFPIDVRGPKGPFFAHSTLELDQQQQALVGRDGIGRERWRISLSDRNGNNYGPNATVSHARVDGHLLLLSMGFQVLAIDTLGTPGHEGPHILWRQELSDGLPGSPRHLGIHGQMIQMPWGQPRFVAADAFNRHMGNLGPVTADFACFQRQRNLVAVHPLTGQTLWTRYGVQLGSDIFGDDEMLFVTPRNSSEAVVLRTLDGQELGRKQVPPLEQRLAVLGRKVLTWTATGVKAHMKFRDLWTDELLWSREFEVSAKPWPVDEQSVAVLDRQGHFVLLSLPDGKAEIDSHVNPEPSLTEIFVFRTPTRNVLVTNRPWQNKDGDNVQPVPGGFGNPLINGFVHGFDRQTGKRVYSTPVDSRSLTLNQPADLPVLVFAAQILRHGVSRQTETVPQAVLFCIDKRTGRVLLNEQSPGPINAIDLIGDPDKQSVTLKTARSAVQMTFTAEAWPVEAAKPVKKEAPASLSTRAGKTVLRGMQKWVDSLTPPAEQPK